VVALQDIELQDIKLLGISQEELERFCSLLSATNVSCGSIAPFPSMERAWFTPRNRTYVWALRPTQGARKADGGKLTPSTGDGGFQVIECGRGSHRPDQQSTFL
jgi:hypothetical protein